MAEPPSPDRRLDLRVSGSARGVVVAPDMEVACLIVDVSGGGLRVRLDRQLALPRRVIVVDVAQATAHDVEVIWQKTPEAGMKRISQSGLRGLTPSRLTAARSAWLRAGGRP
ncbi:PilZ domain-containing protein [Rhizobium sp. CRIBSB]|nr:PilZ domain-containing protein [Rhizobium sp. CRIBSB]